MAPPLIDAVKRHCAGEGAASASKAAAEGSGAAAGGGEAGGSGVGGPEAGGEGGAGEEEKAPLLPLPEALSCLAAAFARCGEGSSDSGAVTAAGAELASAVAAVVGAQLPWQQRLAAAQAAAVVASQAVALRQRAAATGEAGGPEAMAVDGAPAVAQAVTLDAVSAQWCVPVLQPLAECAADITVQQVRGN